ncbi:MAG: patatin-like phospholipase family protein [Bacteroidetes bacterium]|nr:patatin-like phospholipase family protein [Bacteroidota bacterium]
MAKSIPLLVAISFLNIAWAQRVPMQVAGKFFPYLEPGGPKVALVLSGGGARGIAQIGVLEALERAHVPIDLIVGTSMGSIIGGLYASGYDAEELDSVALAQNWSQLLALSDAVSRSDLFLQQKQAAEQSFLVIRLNGLTPVLPSSLSSGQRLTTLLTRLVLNAPYRVIHSFDDLKIPFRAVATDMISGKRVVISKGDLAQALRASSTVPVVFSPIRTDSLQLVDGGLVSNIPVDVARNLGADIVIAVNTTSPLRSEASMDTPWDALDQVTSIMAQLSDKLQLEKANIVITPKLDEQYASDFNNLDTLIYEGRVAAEKQIDRIDSVYESKSRQMLADKISQTKSPDPGGPRLALQTEDTLNMKRPYYRTSHIFISKVKLSGASRLPDSILVRPFDGFIGHTVTPVQINRACEKLIWIFRKASLGMARITNVSYDSSTAILEIDVDEGEISGILLRGNTVAKPFLIRREFPLKKGELFTTNRAIEGINNIYSTNLFSQVLLWTNYNPLPALTIDVSEKSSRLLRFGFRADNERNGQIFSSLSDEDLMGTGTRVGISFSGGLRNRLGEVFLGTTRILNTDLTYGFRAFTGFRDVYYYTDEPSSNPNEWDLTSTGEYRIIRDGYEFSVGTQIKRFGVVKASLSYGWDKLKPLQNFDQKFSARIVSLRVGSFVDTRDKYAFPKSGILSNIYFETSVKGLNSEISFSKIFFEYEAYQTAFSIFTFKQHYQFGFGDATLPLTRQFSLGGQDLFYGLRDDALRGRQVFLASFELRVKLPIKIFFDTYLSGRFDLGDVWAQQQNIVLKTLKQGIGGSLGFDTPIGPIAFSAGKAFYPGKETRFQTLSTPWTFYFRVGVEIPTVTDFQ